MEVITLKRIEDLIENCKKTQELLYQMKQGSKTYYESLTTCGVPVWFKASGSEFSSMLEGHLKEALDYFKVGQILSKLEKVDKVSKVYTFKTRLKINLSA